MTQLASDPNPTGHDAIVKWVHANAGMLVHRLWPPADVNAIRRDAMSDLDPRRDWIDKQIGALKTQVIGDAPDSWSKEHHQKQLDKLVQWWHQYREAWPRSFQPMGAEVIRLEWERPVAASGRSSSIVGFVDLVAEVKQPGFYFDDGLALRDLGRELCVAGAPAWRSYERHWLCCFEIKSQIRSVGEVIRQIQLYRHHLPEAAFVVVSPDTSFTDVLESQGIHFIEFTDPLPGRGDCGGVTLEQLGLPEGP